MNKILLLVCFLFICVPVFSQYAVTDTNSFLKAPASYQYSNPSFSKKVLLGTNYRKVWETPVNAPVFRLKKMGFTIEELGGGMQTKSLRLKDKRGKEWVLRTIEKNVEPNLPPLLQNTLAERVVQDMISAAHPYAPLTIPTLATVIGLVVPVPTLYFVPDDADLKPYTHFFANSLCYLEEREPTPDESKTKSTDGVLKSMLKKNNQQILQEEVLKARLLDMLLADWDRHADQWRWAEKDSTGHIFYYAIPRDRDQAYFNSNGILIKIARYVAVRHFVGFRPNLKKITNLNFKTWKFDRTFLNELDEPAWERIIKEVQAAWTDEVIEKAIHKLPPVIYAINGKKIEQKLKLRRNELLTAGLKYYRFLSTDVMINGTDEEEIFRLSQKAGKLTVSVWAQKNGSEGRKLYERNFTGNQTRNLTLTGLGGKDQFIIEEGVESRIFVRISGGDGSDNYILNGKIRTTIYESADNLKTVRKTRYTKLKSIK